jgi:hypothetical protein
MIERCFNVEELEAIAGLPADDPRHRHAESCPRCRALLASYREFITGRDELADVRADATLADALDRGIFGAQASAADTSPSLLDRLAGLWQRIGEAGMLRPALSAAAVLVIAVAVLSPWDPGPAPERVLRGEGTAASSPRITTRDAQVRPDGSVLVSWRPAAAAHLYRVQILGEDLVEIGSIDAGPDTFLVFHPPATAGGEAASPALLWRVQGLATGEVVATSTAATLPRVGP